MSAFDQPERQIQLTSDQSHTIYLPELDETYHSRNGALNEALYVYLGKGFDKQAETHKTLHIFEMGFGTGLNAILTLASAAEKKIPCTYHSIESSPLDLQLINQLNYKDLLDPAYHALYDAMHAAPWNEAVVLTPYFTLKKIHDTLQTYEPEMPIDLVYFDAFAPDKQPELWTAAIFEKLFRSMSMGAVLVTYSAKGEVKRTLQHIGFTVEKLDGPPYKRHMLRATKP